MAARVRERVLERALATLSDPNEGTLLVVGEPGVGKSHLLQTASERVRLRTACVRISPAESEWELSGLSAVFAAVDPRAVAFSGRFVLRASDPSAMQAAAADILGMLRGLRLPPTAALVDDIDLMDGVSRTLLGFMAGRLGGSGLRIVATATRLPKNDALAGMPHVRLARPSEADALHIARATAEDLDEGTVRIIVASTGGSPAEIRTALGALSDDQILGREPLPLPPVAGEAGRRIAARALDALDEPSRGLVTVLSLAPLVRAQAIDDAGLATPDQVADLVRSGLAEERGAYVRLHDPVVRNVAYDTSRAQERREIHAALARAHEPIDPCLAAWHESFARADGGLGEALMRGALELLGADLADAAVEFADRALSWRTDLPTLASTVSVARLFLARGDRALAHRYLNLVRVDNLDDRERAVLAFARLAVDLALTGRLPEAVLEALVERYGEVNPEAAVSLLTTAALLHALRNDRAPAEAALQAAENLLHRAGDGAVRLHGSVVDMLAACDGAPARRAPASDDALVASAAELVARGRAASLREDYPGAARLFSLALATNERPDSGLRSLARLLLVDNAVRAGRYDEALSALPDLADTDMPDGHRWVSELLAMRIEAVSDLVPEVRARLAGWLDAHHDVGGMAIASAHTLAGEIALAEGDAEEATRELTLADAVARSGPHPGVLRLHPPLIEALVATGQHAAARSAFARFESAAARGKTRWARHAAAGARALLVAPEDGVLLLDRTLAAFEPGGSGLERAQLLARKGVLLRSLGLMEAEGVLLEAQAGFEEHGAHAWARRLHVAAPEPNRNRILDRLSSGERDVARLVMLGHPNKEIAARLFVSLRTVELRLTNIYRKTGLRSRTHLVAALS